MVESLDIDTAMNILGKQAVDISLKTGMSCVYLYEFIILHTCLPMTSLPPLSLGLENARQRVHQTTVDIIRHARSGGGGGGMGG
ncbi:hypothetical protein EON63_19100, partial [archaeon]